MSDRIHEEQVDTSRRAELDQLEEQLRSRLHGRIRNLRVEMRGRGLVLQGNVHSFYEKQLAQQAVMKATHISITANEIKVL